jgi:hypothetical protein
MSNHSNVRAHDPQQGFQRNGLRILEAALACAKRGWLVLPMHTPISQGCSCRAVVCKNVGKHPRVPHGLYDATLDVPTIKSWFTKWPNANIGIATGAQSGLIALDEDPRHGSEESLQALTAKYGKLPDTVESLTGGGGRHRLFKHPGVPIKNDGAGARLGPGLDIRGDAGIIVLPPSLHRSGNRYEWEFSSHPDEVPIAPMPSWMLNLLLNTQKTDRETEIRRNRETEDTEDTEDTEAIASPSPSLSVSQAIKMTLPEHEGQRNRKLFDFARTLKAIPSLANATLVNLKETVRQWHQQALPVIGTKAFDETWAEFAYAWPRVRTALGVDTVASALARADAAELPAAGADYDSPHTRRLLKLCRELQRDSGASPFFLSCRKAGKLLGVDHDTASKFMGMLVGDGVLSLSKAGTARTAARYRYIAEDMARNG